MAHWRHMDARIEILQGLVDREDLDALFALVSVDEVAQTWCRYQHNRPLKPDLDEDENWWAVDEDDLEWLERECRTNDRLRRALATVWCDSIVMPATLARLDAAAGVKLARSQKTPPSVS